MKVPIFRNLISFVTCVLMCRLSDLHQPPGESPLEPIQPFVRKCGKQEEVFEVAEKLAPPAHFVSIGVLTWVPCPLHPCQHSPPRRVDETKNTRTDLPIDYPSHPSRPESQFSPSCLCSKQAQIEANPELKARQEYWFIENWSIWRAWRLSRVLWLGDLVCEIRSRRIFHPQTLGMSWNSNSHRQSYDGQMDVALPSGTHLKLGVLCLIDSSEILNTSDSIFICQSSATLSLSSFNISLLCKFISYLHSEAYGWDYFLRRCWAFWTGIVVGLYNMEYGLEVKVIACIRTP